MSEVRLRFAPSPTGYLHIGGLRTALYDYLFAKKNGGKYILRIEDTDRQRYVDGSIENLIQSLEWAGVVHDEGVFLENGRLVEKGDYGPYIQSERLDIYKEHVDKLLESGYAYYCFCDKERLESLREHQKKNNLMLGYDGFCRDMSKEDAEKRIANGEEYVIRLRLPENYDITFTDLIRGEITVNTKDLDDQVLMKSDGFPTYHLAAVVDDHLMKITHVVRGEEWLPSAPKHVYLYQAFGWNAPEFAHLPTVLNSEKKKLSKRHGSVAVEDFRGKGYLPEALVNYLALVGWSPDKNQEFFSLEELVEDFSFERVSKAGGVFDINKLNWVNGHYIRESDIDSLTELAIPVLLESKEITEEDVADRIDWIKALVAILKDRVHTINEIPEKLKSILDNDVEFEDDEAEKTLRESEIDKLLTAFEEELNEVESVDEEFAATVVKKIQKKTGIKGKNLFMPIRIALTGQQHGPDLDKIILVLGKENLLKRIEIMKNK